MLDCLAQLQTLRVCTDHRDRAATAGGSIAAAPLINPRVASQGEMWTMLMQMLPSADAIGQFDCEASRAMGARTLVARAAFAQAPILGRASGSESLENESREISREIDDMLA
jgi:hypothetical protein